MNEDLYKRISSVQIEGSYCKIIDLSESLINLNSQR
jgi:hypothetical protein